MNTQDVTSRFASTEMLQRRGMLMLALLVLQFIAGMTLNLFIQIPTVHPGTSGSYLSRSVAGFVWALTNGGGVGLTIHVVLASVLMLGGLATLGFAIAARHRVWIIAGSFGLLGSLLALLNGIEFINTGLDKHSFAMAMAFLIALVSYSLGLYLAKTK